MIRTIYMKHSLKKIFQNLNTYMLFVVLFSFLFMMLTLEKQLSFDKVDNLNTQKKIINSLAHLKKDDIELALIQFNGKSAQLHNQIEKLHEIYKYSLTERYITGKSQQYLKDLGTLAQLIDRFSQSANNYYSDVKKSKQQEVADLRALKKAFFALNNHINTMIVNNIEYDKARFNLFKNLSIFAFIVVLLATLWYRKRLYNILRDINYLATIDKQTQPYQIFTQEADAISLRMKRKNVQHTQNPAFIDQVTGINNHKGLLNSYSNKKGMKDSNFTAVTVLEIDNFSKSHRPYTQDITQAILKKIAFTISLHEQPTDVIARTDYNQFTIILSRASKEQTFKDMDIIRESIAELKFNLPNNEHITVTGGFIIKPNNTNLDEALKQAKEILSKGKTIGNNKILQTRDIADMHT